MCSPKVCDLSDAVFEVQVLVISQVSYVPSWYVYHGGALQHHKQSALSFKQVYPSPVQLLNADANCALAELGLHSGFDLGSVN
jgi:hypothetical protein